MCPCTMQGIELIADKQRLASANGSVNVSLISCYVSIMRSILCFELSLVLAFSKVFDKSSASACYHGTIAQGPDDQTAKDHVPFGKCRVPVYIMYRCVDPLLCRMPYFKNVAISCSQDCETTLCVYHEQLNTRTEMLFVD